MLSLIVRIVCRSAEVFAYIDTQVSKSNPIIEANTSIRVSIHLLPTIKGPNLLFRSFLGLGQLPASIFSKCSLYAAVEFAFVLR